MKIISLKLGALRLFILLVSCFLAGNAAAQSIQTRVDTDSLTIGEIFNYSLIVQLDKEYRKVEFPDTSAFPSSLELIERQQFKSSEFSDSLSFQLQFFGNENLQLPSLPVTLYSENDTSVIYSEPITLLFKSVVAEGDTTLKPMKPIYAFPRAWWPWILAALVLSAVLFWWFKFRETEEKEPEQEPNIEPFYNPLNELEKTLSTIKEETNVAQTKDFKLFYSEVGDAIRSYFEDLYNIPALECTTSELLRYLEAYGVDDTLTEKTRTVLRKADLVKFAKYTPTLDDAWHTYDHAIDFLERAKLADSARISRLKAQYDRQYMSQSTQTENEA